MGSTLHATVVRCNNIFNNVLASVGLESNLNLAESSGQSLL